MAAGTEASDEKKQKRVGTTVRGKYTIDAFLATGTMANVYSATHRNGSRVALKVLHKQLAQDEGLCERFRREGYFANSIGHPGVVKAIDDDVTEDGCPFLVMELLEGETLEERRKRKGGKLPAAWVLPVAETLLEILAAAHAREVVHRDLKPDNVFITKAGEVKVLDFGVARWNDGQASSDMTAMGMVLGTPAYMPPEQALGRREDVDAQSDLWAVGATLFVVLSGESVHEGGDAKAKLIATARTAARPLNEAAPQVPRAIAAVIDRALAFYKRDRWLDAEAMREALKWARQGVEPPPVSSLAPEPLPLPVETKRNFDEEPTLARMSRDDLVPPTSSFLTSAPPITMRNHRPGQTTQQGLAVDPAEAMASALSAGIASEPIFSLRREKEKESGSGSVDVAMATPHSGMPSTERLAQEGRGKALQKTLQVQQAPTTDPLPAEARDVTAVIAPAEEPRSVELNMSFTRPMAAMVMPSDYPAPRPAAGEPPDELPPPPAPLPSMAHTAPMPEYPSAPAVATYPPPPVMPSEPPGMREGVITMPAQRFRGTDTPGPVLAQVVRPKGGRFVRIFVPLLVASAAVGAVLFFLRLRAARARGAIAQSPVATQVVASPPAPPITSVASAELAPAPPPPAPTENAAPSPTETASVAAADPAPAPTTTAKKKKKKKPKPPPADTAETAPADPPPDPPPMEGYGDTGGN